ncbi:MAG TPA: hypothetical protein VM925_10155 [Labilithrix sp.]|nr:hypothetical protein [Labilithrix sp.]
MRRSTMQLTSASVLVALTALAVVVSACGGSDPPPPTTPSATAYPQQPPPGYYPPQQPPGAYPQNTGAYPQSTGAAPQAAPTAATTGTMATPGPLALPCQNDSACGFHRCNTQFQKCAFPCQGPADCAQGNQCMMGVCAPKPPGSP